MRATLLAVMLAASACSSPAPKLTCADGRVDGLETDLDCGGAHCPTCPAGKICLGDADCADGVCALNRCAAPTCWDAVHNGDELGLDCGGSCGPCEAQLGCKVPADCTSGRCVDGGCAVPTCSDSTRNGIETDVDCGGSSCPACTDGKNCARNTDCEGGSCFDGKCAAACVAPLKECNNACVDATTDRDNCGNCGMACPAGSTCAAGQCGLICLGGAVACGGACVDTLSNPLHCGGCGQPCGGGPSCIGGACIFPCPPGQVVCGGACVSLDRNAAHCGGCNQPCAPAAGCLGSQCAAGCPAPLTSCPGGSACVDAQNDPFNCGGCGIPCPVLPGAPRTCSNGTCVLGACFSGFADCNGVKADGCEGDLGLSSSCGACGRACPVGFCVQGRCCDALPPGTYQASCTNCEACEGFLTCLCNDAAQNPQPASIPLGPCPGGFTNCNGVLLCNGC